MIKLIENKTKYKFYGIKLDRLGGWSVYQKDREGVIRPHVFLVDELFNERFTPVEDQ